MCSFSFGFKELCNRTQYGECPLPHKLKELRQSNTAVRNLPKIFSTRLNIVALNVYTFTRRIINRK